MTPQLRFPGFTDEWQVKKLGDVTVKVGSGSTPRGGSKVYTRSGIPFIRSQNVREGRLDLRDVVYIDEKVHRSMSNSAIQPGDVLLNITGASLGRTCVVPIDLTEGNLSQHVCIIRLKDTNPYLVHTILSKPKSLHELLKTQTGGGKEGLNFQAVKSFKLALSGTQEQQKIADYMRGIDSKLTSIQAKVAAMHEYKKGVMQALFSGKLRFKDENGNPYPDWEEKRLGGVFSERTERSGQGEMLSVTIGSGIVPLSSLTRKDNSSSDKSNYKCVKIDDIAYNSMRMWQGASGVSDYDGIVSPAYTVITPKAGNDSRFWGYRFKTTDATNTFQRYSQGLTSDTWNLKFNTLSKITFMAPCYEEQQKIADFLTTLDDKLKLEEAKLASAKEFKKALLQRMFV